MSSPRPVIHIAVDEPTHARVVAVFMDDMTRGSALMFQKGGGMELVFHIDEKVGSIELDAERGRQVALALAAGWTRNERAARIALSPVRSAERIARELVLAIEELRSSNIDTTVNLMMRAESILRDEFGA